MVTKTNQFALICEIDVNLHQVILTDEQCTAIGNYAAALHGGTLQVREEPIMTIELKRQLMEDE